MSELTAIIRSEIAKHGVLPFSRFMELSLYHPQLGYYEQPRRVIGRSGDFITSVSVGSLFGELLASRFAAWLEKVSPSGPLHLLEAGAHHGQLAVDVLSWLRQERPALWLRLEYWLIEPSPVRAARQREALASFKNVRWWDSLSHIPDGAGRGIFFSNELLDAFPVTRLRWNAPDRRWDEWGVGQGGEALEWRILKRPPGHFDEGLARAGIDVPADLAAVLPDGFTLEVSEAAGSWWAMAARKLGRGKLVAIDYGRMALEFLHPSRSAGTLRCYCGHRMGDDPLRDPGARDLTTHVNFTQLIRAGEAEGLTTESLTGQGAFLTDVARSHWLGTDGHVSLDVRQLLTLTHPDHLGGRFKVLVQARS